MSAHPRADLTTTPQPPAQTVPVEPLDALALSQEQRQELCIDVIHDGDYIPQDLLIDHQGRPITLESIEADYARERDWGACLVAERVAARLGLGAITRVNVARVLMDFGRFPGATAHAAAHLDRFAINYPFSELLSFQAKRQVLETCYDAISTTMEQALRGKRLKIAIHTYDQFNASGTERPATSILTRTLSYQNTSRMGAGFFDPLFPDILAEFTSDRILRDRLSLMLEKSGIPVAHNYPYCLPEGSLEVRYQVWVYFQALRRHFEAHRPETREDDAFELVWRMLLDTNLRSSESDTLRSYIHMFRRAPEGQLERYQAAALAYEQLRQHCALHGDEFVHAYRFSPDRASSLGFEVRKDLLVTFDAQGRPLKVRWENVRYIGDAIAEAIALYMREDRADRGAQRHDLDRRSTWYQNL